MIDEWLRRGAPLLAAVLVAASALACASRMVPLTQEARIRHKLTDEELKSLQYYVSNRIVLRRVMESEERRVTGSHKLQVVAGKNVEEIVIEKGTPGVAVSVAPDLIAVSFEPGAALQFSLRRTAGPTPPPEPDPAAYAHAPDPFPGNRPREPEPEPAPPRPRGPDSGLFWLGLDPPTHLVPYAGKLFEPIGETLQAHLLVDAESLDQVEETKRVLPGVRLPREAAPAAGAK
jgi:hypothetical protein